MATGDRAKGSESLDISKNDDDSFTSSASFSSNEDSSPTTLASSSTTQGELQVPNQQSELGTTGVTTCDLTGTRFRIEGGCNTNNSGNSSATIMMASALNLHVVGQNDGGGQAENRMTNSSPSLTDITLDQAISKLQEIERENMALRDNLRHHNAMVKKQYEALSAWREKENEKFEQTKALITALKAENQELQVKVMTVTDKEVQLSKQVQALEEEKAHLQRKKAISDQQVYNVYKMAEQQGVKGLVREELEEVQDLADAMVYVSVSEKEETIAKLELELADKQDIIANLRADTLKKDEEVNKFRESTKNLLKDMESQQKLKKDIEAENRRLTTQLMETEEKLHKHIQSAIASTKQVMRAENVMTVSSMAGSTTTATTTTAAGQLGTQGRPGENFSFPENVEDLMGIAKSLEAREAEEMTRSRLEKLLEEERKEKQALAEEVEKLKVQHRELVAEVADGQKELEDFQQQASDRADKQAQEYEQKLMEMAKHDRPGPQAIQASDTEDTSILRSQVLTLIREVDEVQGKLSAAMAAISHKDNRIMELEQVVQNLKKEINEHWQERHALMKNLQLQHSQQQEAQRENNLIKRQREQLQHSFTQLVNDYKELEETFEVYRRKMEHHPSQQRTKETMEEINRLTAQVIAADEAIALKEEQVMQLERQLANVTSNEDEKIQLLQFQADVYKADFEAERDSRAKLAEERNHLLEQLKAMHEQNRALMEEQEGYNQRQLNDMQRRQQNPGVPASESPNRLRATPPLAQDYMHAGTAQDPRQGVRDVRQNVPDYRRVLAGPPYVPVIPERNPLQQAGNAAEDEEDLPSFQELECPACAARFPDIDSLQLHVPDCIDNNR